MEQKIMKEIQADKLYQFNSRTEDCVGQSRTEDCVGQRTV